jgi:hypothetical protein
MFQEQDSVQYGTQALRNKIATATSCLSVLEIPVSVLRDCDLLEELRLEIHLPQRKPGKELPSAQFEKDLADTFRGSETVPPVKSLEININCHTKANCLPKYAHLLLSAWQNVCDFYAAGNQNHDLIELPFETNPTLEPF